MTHEWINHEIAIVLVFVVPRLAREQVAARSELGHLNHPREHLDVPCVVLPHLRSELHRSRASSLKRVARSAWSIADVDRNDSKSGLASPNHPATVSGLVLAFIEADFCK